jgi:hypothetical protein
MLDPIQELLVAGLLTSALRVVVDLEVVAEEVRPLPRFGCAELVDQFGHLLHPVICRSHHFVFGHGLSHGPHSDVQQLLRGDGGAVLDGFTDCLDGLVEKFGFYFWVFDGFGNTFLVVAAA